MAASAALIAGLGAAANDNTAIQNPQGQLVSCQAIIAAAKLLATSTS